MDQRPGSPPHGRLDVALSPFVRTLDVAAVVLIVLALSVTFFGGLRVMFGAWRVSFTSPVRTWLWAVVILALRHRVVREPSLLARLQGAGVRGWASADVRTALAVTIGSRLPLLLVGYLAVASIGYPPTALPFRVSTNELVNLPARWDSGWYLGIATEGYHWRTGRVRQQNVVFFPAYPMLLRAGSRLLGDRPAAIALVGLFVSLSAFCAALVYFLRLARDRLDDSGAATAAWLMAAYPFAVFYGSVYTESLFLLATVAAFCEFRRDRLWAAGGWGLLAGLTRPTGCFLSLVLAANIVERHRAARRTISGAGSDTHLRRLGPRLLSAAMPGVGMLLYSAYVYQLTGNAFEWARGHAAWGRTYQGPLKVLGKRYEMIASGGLYEYTSTLPVDALNLAAALLAIVAIWPIARRWGPSFALLVALGVFVPLSSGILLSMGRITAVLFPIFLWLAEIVPPRTRPVWLVAFAMVQALTGVLFFTWRQLV